MPLVTDDTPCDLVFVEDICEMMPRDQYLRTFHPDDYKRAMKWLYAKVKADEVLIADKSITEQSIIIENRQRDYITLKPLPQKHNYIKRLITFAAGEFNVTEKDISGMRRSRKHVRIRQAIWYLARLNTKYSYNQMAQSFCKRDHSTLFHGIEKAEKLLEMASHPNPSQEATDFAAIVEALERVEVE